VWLEHDGPIAICVSGLHASRRPWHALAYAPGPVLCVVEVEGVEAEHDDKLVARRRRIVRRVDLTDDLRAFARQCALDVIHLWDAPDVVRRYLETGDESLRNAAWEAATDTMRDVTTAATWDIAMAAAWDTARDAATEAARDAAWDVAWTAAYDAARARAYGTAKDVETAAEYDTAWDTSRAAAWAAYGERFDALCASRLEVEL